MSSALPPSSWTLRPHCLAGTHAFKRWTFQQQLSLTWPSAHMGKWGQLTLWKNGWKIKKRKHAKEQFSEWWVRWTALCWPRIYLDILQNAPFRRDPAPSSNGAAARRSAANAGSVVLTTKGRGWTVTTEIMSTALFLTKLWSFTFELRGMKWRQLIAILGIARHNVWR